MKELTMLRQCIMRDLKITLLKQNALTPQDVLSQLGKEEYIRQAGKEEAFRQVLSLLDSIQ